MRDKKLKIIPLGGAGEIGKNMTIYEYDDHILIVDCGIMFPKSYMHGVDLILPDWQYLENKKEKVCGLVVTHGHEDHIGAIPYLLRDGFLNVPIYATALTRGLIEHKLKEHRLLRESKLHTYNPKDRIQLGPFEVEPIRVNHSIPDAVGVAVHTPVGTIVQTGDFKFDPTPFDNFPTDMAHLARLGSEGVHMLLGDSTGVEKKGSTGSEALVQQALSNAFAEAEGRILVSSFASQLQRIQQVLWLAHEHKRVVALTGRSMLNYTRIARQVGCLNVPPDTLVSIQEASLRKNHEVVFLATGSQGEPNAALARISKGSHRDLEIEEGDTVILSASPIPGNEESVSIIIDRLFRLGANVVYDAIAKVHVSGHGGQDDLILMQQLLNPTYVVPVHGEYRHLVLHSRLATKLGVPSSNTFVVEDGQTLMVDKNQVTLGKRVPGGWVFVDGRSVGAVGPAVLRDREGLSRNGFIVAVITIDGMTDKPIDQPRLISRGFVFLRHSEELFRQAEICILHTLKQHQFEAHDISNLEHKIKKALEHFFYAETGRRPMVMPLVVVV